jgi:hypothetical protein
MTITDARLFALTFEARSHLGEPYIWGDADCSKLVCDVLTATAARGWVGLYDGKRRTAQGLDEFYSTRGCLRLDGKADLRPGALVFYRRVGAEAIHHVAMHVCTLPSGVPMALEAGGAGSKATSFEAALRASGCVRWTDSDYHGEGVEWWSRDPFQLAVS